MVIAQLDMLKLCVREVLTLSDAELKGIMSDGYNVYVFIGDELKSA